MSMYENLVARALIFDPQTRRYLSNWEPVPHPFKARKKAYQILTARHEIINQEKRKEIERVRAYRNTLLAQIEDAGRTPVEPDEWVLVDLFQIIRERIDRSMLTVDTADVVVNRLVQEIVDEMRDKGVPEQDFLLVGPGAHRWKTMMLMRHIPTCMLLLRFAQWPFQRIDQIVSPERD